MKEEAKLFCANYATLSLTSKLGGHKQKRKAFTQIQGRLLTRGKMSEEDLDVTAYIVRSVGHLGVALRVLVLIGACVGYFYPEEQYFLGYGFTVYPFRQYFFGLVTAGAVLVFVGGILGRFRLDIEKQKTKHVPSPAVTYASPSMQSIPRKYCRYSEAENKTDAVFCEKCGKHIG
jgi:hypothetical protein